MQFERGTPGVLATRAGALETFAVGGNFPSGFACENTLARALHQDKTLRVHLVYAYLVRRCLMLTTDAYRDITRAWQLDARTITSLGIVSVPSEVFNVVACGALAERFGDLSDVAGFFRRRDCWRLDVDAKLAGRGLILPVRDCWRLRIVALRVFRHVRDERPFLLRTRTGEQLAA